jgi:hypothetical protein
MTTEAIMQPSRMYICKTLHPPNSRLISPSGIGMQSLHYTRLQLLQAYHLQVDVLYSREKWQAGGVKFSKATEIFTDAFQHLSDNFGNLDCIKTAASGGVLLLLLGQGFERSHQSITKPLVNEASSISSDCQICR